MGFFRAVERKIDVDMTDLLSDGSIRNRGILRQNFELVCSARCRNDISRKYVLFLRCNAGSQSSNSHTFDLLF